MTILGTVLALVALNSLTNKHWVISEHLPERPGLTQLIGLAIGTIAVMVGIGGGALLTPILLAFSVPIKMAVGTATLSGLLISTPGLVAAVLGAKTVPTHDLLLFSVGYLNIPLVAAIVPFAIVAARWGAALSHRLPANTLRKAFAFYLLLVAGRMLYSALN